MYKKILVPLDGSKRAEAILPHVKNLALCFKAKAIFFIVIEPGHLLEHDEIIGMSINVVSKSGKIPISKIRLFRN